MAKRGLRSEPVATRKRRHLAVDADTSSSTYTYGGAVAFKNAWKALLKGAWTSKPPPRQSRDDRFRYIRPGDDPAGKEGLDILLGESAVMRFVKAPTSAPNSGTTLENAGTTGTVEVVVVTTLVVVEVMLVEAKATSVETELTTSLRMRPLRS
ncbi:hypothetical protein GQ600_4985 [Phytophthora cactorum]|nr:hypothetical protein GQ600_4985 [Phytophthora cactorum]